MEIGPLTKSRVFDIWDRFQNVGAQSLLKTIVEARIDELRLTLEGSTETSFSKVQGQIQEMRRLLGVISSDAQTASKTYGER